MIENEFHPPILMVDDDAEAHELIRRGLERARVPNPVLSFHSGAAVMAYLAAEPPPTDSAVEQKFCFMLLDVRMPGPSGLDVLSWIRTQSHLFDLNVVMLSSADEIEDVPRAKELGASTYLLKYPAPETLAAIAKYARLAQV